MAAFDWPLPVLQLLAHPLGDAAKAEAEHKDKEDEDHARGEEIVAVRRVHHVLVERQRAFHRGHLPQRRYEFHLWGKL